MGLTLCDGRHSPYPSKPRVTPGVPDSVVLRRPWGYGERAASPVCTRRFPVASTHRPSLPMQAAPVGGSPDRNLSMVGGLALAIPLLRHLNRYLASLRVSRSRAGGRSRTRSPGQRTGPTSRTLRRARVLWKAFQRNLSATCGNVASVQRQIGGFRPGLRARRWGRCAGSRTRVGVVARLAVSGARRTAPSTFP
jgi:hypothetical protein